MEDKHPIDQFFTDGLHNTDIPFDESQWVALSKKMHVRRSFPRFLWIGGGAVAATIIAALLLFDGRDATKDNQVAPPEPALAAQSGGTTTKDTSQAPAATAVLPSPAGGASPSASSGVLVHAPASTQGIFRGKLTPVQTQGLTVGPQPAPMVNDGIPRHTLRIPNAVPSTVTDATTDNQGPGEEEITFHRGWSLSITAAPDLSGTRPLAGRPGGHIGLAATYRLNPRLSVTTGAFYGRKLYRADFADYRPSTPWPYPQLTPSLVAADCYVLDIPLNLNLHIAGHRRSSWFASAGLSSYLMLRETYDYTYPPHEYGGVKTYTLRNQNRHIMGIGNVAIGYRRQVGAEMGITIQPFIKVPLTGIGNGNFKLYSSGIAISADIALSRSNRQ